MTEKYLHYKHKTKYFNFLVAVIISILTGVIVTGQLTELRQKKIYNDIYTKLPCYVYDVRACIELGLVDNPCNHCAGISKDGYLFIPAHCLDIPENFNMMGVTNLDLYVDGVFIPNNRKIHFDRGNDVAVFKLPDNMKNRRDFPCSIDKNVHLGEEVFVISTLVNSGIVVRKAIISSINLNTKINAKQEIERAFWIDSGGFPGESGSPVVSSDYKLVGLIACSLNPVFMGVKYIGEYARHLE